MKKKKSGIVFDDLLSDIEEKGLAPLARDIMGLDVKIANLFNHLYFVINYRTRNVDRTNIYLFIINVLFVINSLLNKSCFESCSQQNPNMIFSLNGYVKE